MKSFMNKTAIYLSFAVISGASVAQDAANTVVYFGAGPAKSASSTETGDTPYSLGFISMKDTSDTVFGLDISAEGTMLDSTWGKTNALQQGTSLNFLLGRNLVKGESGRFDASLLLGIRQESADCPSSYLGYQCYADSEPERDYGFNYGVVLSYTYKKVMLGLRLTGESTQALIGFRF